MPHYSNLDVNKEPRRSVCQYCGRPIKTNTSRNQGCGDVCRNRHRNSKYRVIQTKEVKLYERFVRFKKCK